MKYLFGLIATVFLVAVTGSFLGWPGCGWAARLQVGPALMGLSLPPLIVLLLLAAFYGRFFCRTMCPLGILQTLVNRLVHFRRPVKRICSRLPVSRTQLAVRVCIVVLVIALGVAGMWGLVGALDPYAIYGRFLTAAVVRPVQVTGLFAAYSLGVFALVMVLAAFGKGRVWCNWICPIGSVLTLLGRFSWRHDGIGDCCGNCQECFRNALAENGSSAADKPADAACLTRREALQGVAAVAVAEKLTDGGYADVSLPGVPQRPVSVLPPGAGSRSAFASKCVGCQACVTHCPEQVLKPSTRLRTFGQPEMDFRYGFCRPTCTRCGEVCPSGAIRPLTKELKLNAHLGHAIWRKDLCVRTTSGDPCTACERKCPQRAIHIVGGCPVIDRDRCVGCGACEHVCPARPEPAIFVKGFETQRIVVPISKDDLVAEMRALVRGGKSVVIAREGRIVAQEDGHGVAPLLRLLSARELRGALVYDKVIGRAAAAICIVGAAKEVHAEVMGEDARSMLTKHGIVASSEVMAKQILNRDRSGSCPLEATVSVLDEPDRMVDALRKQMESIQKTEEK